MRKPAWADLDAAFHDTTVELAGAQRDLRGTVRAAMHERVREALARQGLARGILDEDAALAKVLAAEDLQALFEPVPA
jgi:plasmid stability protein